MGTYPIPHSIIRRVLTYLMCMVLYGMMGDWSHYYVEMGELIWLMKYIVLFYITFNNQP